MCILPYYKVNGVVFCPTYACTIPTPFPLSRDLVAGPVLLGGGRWGVRQHIHLLSMLRQFDIPSLSHPFVSAGIFLDVIIQIK
jgi:hypothetical protein